MFCVHTFFVENVHFPCLCRHFCGESFFSATFVESNIFSLSSNNTSSNNNNNKKYPFVVTVVSSFPSFSHFSLGYIRLQGDIKTKYQTQSTLYIHKLLTFSISLWTLVGCLSITCLLMQFSFNKKMPLPNTLKRPYFKMKNG